MPTSGHPLESLLLHFRCPVSEDELLDLLRRVAALLRPEGGVPQFQLSRRQALPDRTGGGKAKEEVWVSKGARIEGRITAIESPLRQGYDMTWRLVLDTGFQLEIKDASPDPWPHELKASLYHVWPRMFDAIRDLFRRHLDPEADATDAPRTATLNAQVALDGGQGAFARHLLDQALERRRAEPLAGDEEEEWWTRLKNLSQQVGSGGPGT